MVEYDPRKLPQDAVVRLIEGSHRHIQVAETLEPLASRRLVLPIVFDHPEIRQAEQRYSEMQRSKAAYLPDNVTYIQENNSLMSRDAVFSLLKKTRMLVVAVGFMTGLPLLLPLDPRARIVAQKYNPTRISTPAGAIGIGGSIMCIYPTQQPGGYMLVGRTIPVWDMHALRPGFSSRGRPWLCEPFDVIEFREVSLAEYDRILDDFEAGTYDLSVEDCMFDVAQELALEKTISALPETTAFRKSQKSSAEAMRLREEDLYAAWLSEQAVLQPVADGETKDELLLTRFVSPHSGKIYRVLVRPGDRIESGQALVVLESMKMEITVSATKDYAGFIVKRIVGKEGSIVSPDTTLMFLE